MSFDLERLFELLPAIYRQRDIELAELDRTALSAGELSELAELRALFNSSPLTEPQFRRLEELEDKQRRGPLKALLGVIAEQVAVLEEGLESAYDDQFIESCAEWVVPYIGDLVGTTGLFVYPGASFSQRSLVANTLGLRRRKGTAAVIEQLARDVTGWDASVVEYFERLATTQYLNHIRLENLAFADLRHSKALDYINTPFDRTAHTADVRNIASKRGKYNIPNIGVFLWRLGSYSITASPAYGLDDRRYFFDALGKDTQLFNLPEVEEEITHLAEPVNVPHPFRRRELDRYLESHYGSEKGMLVYRDGSEVVPVAAGEVLSDLVCVCDLSDLKDDFGVVTGWAHMPEDRIAIDPVLGRLAFPSNVAAPQSVHVTYHYGFSAELGGGEYERTVTSTGEQILVRVPADQLNIQSAINVAVTALNNNPHLDAGVVEIERPASVAASDYHIISGIVDVPAGRRIILRGADEHRPVVVLDGDLQVRGGNDSEFEVDGLLLTGGGLHIPAGSNRLRLLRMTHSSISPAPSPAIKNVAARGVVPSLIINASLTHVELSHCIVGSIKSAEGSEICLTSSIVDAGSETAVAYSGLNNIEPGGPLVAKNCTIIGRVHTVKMQLASNTIFFARSTFAAPVPVRAEMLQEGCVRFCYVPPNSRLPRQFECQPQTPADAARVRPSFTSLRYGDAGYCQLSIYCSGEIKRGADDEAEIGVFHDLYQPQRISNLRARLGEFLRFGLEAGVFEAT